MNRKKYHNVYRRDWYYTNKETIKDMAYALTNHKECFAELSVTYLCDFYKELDNKYDTFEACSPPFLKEERIRCCAIMVDVPHCNKFFPFTRGQLKNYDHETFRVMKCVWEDIALWRDDYVNVNMKSNF